MLAISGAAGCVDSFEDELELESEADESNLRAGGYPVVECSTHNVIGVLHGRGGECSLPGMGLSSDWQWHTMFADFTPDLQLWTETLPVGLQPYCIYEYVGPGEPNPEAWVALFSAIDNYPGMDIDSVAPDCRGEVVQGNGLDDDEVKAGLAQAFHSAIQWITPERLHDTVGNREYAEVAVLDTVSQDAFINPAIDPISHHGLFMGDIIEDISCPLGEAECTDAIHYHVAMPRYEDSSADYLIGGDHGTMGDLAMAIVAAVGQWREKRLNDPLAPQRLIISASLGWVPESPVTSDPNRGPVRAIEEALNFAACNGAIVLAAAGNVTDAACGENEVGPLAPATYEVVPALSEAECMLRGYWAIDTFDYPVFDQPRPLVWAAGGFDGKDRVIPNQRAKSMPAFGAYAANATVEPPGGGHTMPLTGTSVSTAVLAATANLVWSYFPKLTPDQVMRVIAEGSYETGLAADFDFTGTHPRVRRVSVCGALAMACQSATPGQCPELDCGDPAPALDGYLGDYYQAVDKALVDPGNSVEVIDGSVGVAPICAPPVWDEQIDPQPQLPACPECMIDSPAEPDPDPDNDMLSMSIDSNYKGLVTAVKFVGYDVTGYPTVFDLSNKVISSLNDVSTFITVVNLDAPGTVAATLSIKLADGSTQDGPIVVRNP